MAWIERGRGPLLGALSILVWLPLSAGAQDEEAPGERPDDTVAARLASGDPVERFETALEQIEALEVYNDQMRELIAAQQAELTSLNEQVSQVEVVKRSIPELLIKMVDALEQFVERDLPFNDAERKKAVADLRLALRDPNVTDAERYRRIMDVYMVENEYGRSNDAYRGTIDKGGEEIPVYFLRFGRIALIYQTLDESEAGIWDKNAKTWVELDDEYNSAIHDALRIARKQAAPDLVNLPVPAATGS